MPKRKKSNFPKRATHCTLALCDKLIPTQARRNQFELICQALEPLPDAVSITDPKQNRLLYINPAWQKLYRYTPSEALCRQPSILNLSDESEQLIDAIVAGTKNGGWSGRVLNQDKHRHIFSIQLRTSLVYDARKKVIGHLGISTPDHPPALGPEQIQSIIDAQTAALHHILGQTRKNSKTHNQDIVPGNAPDLRLLSAREREVFLHIGHGLTPVQIADRLHLSVHTIHAHRTNIRTKLNLSDAASLTYWAIHWADQGGLT